MNLLLRAYAFNFSFASKRVYSKCLSRVTKHYDEKLYLKRPFSSGILPIDSLQNLKKDVLLYTFEKTKIFKYVSVFGIAQLGIWIYYAKTMFYSLRDIKSEDSVPISSETSLWRRINLGEMRYRIIAVLGCLSIGLLTAFITLTLPTRIVKELVLCKGGKTALFTTYAAFGKTTKRKVPLDELSCLVSRKEGKSYITIKIKNHWMYYLIDANGKFIQPLLFDLTVGTKTSKRF